MRLAILLTLITTIASGQSVDGALKTLTASGTDTYTFSEPLPAAYSSKERYLLRFTNANTGPATLNRNSLGAKSIKKDDGSELSANDIQAGGTYMLSYNGTNWQIVGGGSGGGGGSGTVTSVALASGTTGTDVNVSGSPITTSGTITLNIPTASGTNRGVLSSADWTTFNGKGDLLAANNLSDVGNATTALGNIGGQPLDGDLTSIAAISATGVIPYRSAGNTYGTVTIGSGLSFSAGTLSNSGIITETDPVVKAISGIVKSDGSTISAAVSGTDYAPATSGTSILKGNGSGGFSNATAGTDYVTASSTNTFTNKSGNISQWTNDSGYLTSNQTITLSGAVTGSGSTSITTTIATPGTLSQSSTNSTATAHTHAITSSNSPGAAASILATDASGHIGTTGSRIVKGWFTDLAVTNTISGSITGNAATVTTNANLTGDVTSSGNATTIANDAVTFAKFQNITDARLLGRSAGSSGDMQEITIGSGLSLSAGTLTATGGGGGGSAHVIRDGNPGTPLTARTNLDFTDDNGRVSFTLTDDAINDATVVTVTSKEWTTGTYTTQITSDQNDYNPTDWSGDYMHTWYLSGDNGIRAITSFAAPASTTALQRKRLYNVGIYPIYFPSEHPSGTAANRFNHYQDFILPPKRGVDIEYDQTAARWRFIGGYDANWYGNGLTYSVSAGSITAADHGELGFAQVGTGAAAASIVATAGTRPGGYSLSTGTTATGVASIYFAKTAGAFASFGDAHVWGEAYVALPTLSNGTNTFTAYFQLTNSVTSTTAEPNNGLYVRYSDAINSGKWQFVSQDNAGAETVVDTGVTVAVNTNYLIRIEIDKSRTEARCYINGNFVGRITANIPSAATCGPRAVNVKTVGTTASVFYVFSMSSGAIYP